MSKAEIILAGDGMFYGIGIECPGCLWPHDGSTQGHILMVDWLPEGQSESPYVKGKPHWTFNGDLERPTFSPSLLLSADYKSGPYVCHSFIRDGRIQFLNDCTHALAGQTVDLPEIEE